MGVYDTLPNGQQIKCYWNEMRDINFGDQVPNINSTAKIDKGYRVTCIKIESRNKRGR